MKRMLMTASITFSVMLLVAFQNKTLAQPPTDDPIEYQDFYDELDPYGEWMDYPDYGYVWVPDAGPDFQPYSTNGHWVWSDEYEWMWVSDYNWGWAPFHYGRWFYDPLYGWMWVPGYEWSPAWVAWRDGGDYYGWAPLRPGFSIGININIGGYNPPVDYWCFAPRRYITSPRIYDYYVPRHNNITIINQTTIINNYNYRQNVWRTGPRRFDAERYTGRINPVSFRNASAPGRASFRNNEVSMYRPRVNQDNNRTYAPRRFERIERNNASNNNNNGIAGGRRNNPNNLPERRNENGINRPGRNNNRIERNENGIIRNRDENGTVRNTPRNPRVDRQENNNNTNRPDINRPGNSRPNRNFDRPQRNSDANTNGRPQRNFERPQRNIERPQTNAERPQRNFERPQRNVERPQRNMERPRPQTPSVNNERRIQGGNGFGRGNSVPRAERRQMGAERPQRQPQVQQRTQQPRQVQPRQESRQPQSRENRGGGGNRGGFGRNR